MIIGLNFNSINAKINKTKVEEGAQVSVNSKPIITSVEKMDFLNMKDVVMIGFKFETTYEPKIGEIVIEGDVIYKEGAKVLKMWKSQKKLEDDVAVEVLNAVFRRCLVKVTELSNDLRLPPPVRFPVVTSAKQEEKYIG